MLPMFVRMVGIIVGCSVMTSVSAEMCSDAKMAAILSPENANKAIGLDCSVNLGGKTITRPLVFKGERASNVTLDCQGGSVQPAGADPRALYIQSIQNEKGEWSVPSNITIRNCTVYGHTRVTGLGINGEALPVRDSSRKAGHTERTQAIAPHHITFNKVKLVGKGTIPLYLSPGVHHVTLENSRVSGRSASVAIYMDAESSNNRIINNGIDTDTDKRELIAIDGSAHNEIVNNRLSALDNGGIYLYRNCGEGGTIRHQSPQYNTISNNRFYYDKYRGSNPAIWLGSRQGMRLYCFDDRGYNFGSSLDNHDFARYNTITNNHIAVRKVKDMIVVEDTPNTVFGNVTE